MTDALHAVVVAAALALAVGPAPADASTVEHYGGRELIVHVPDRLPPAGSRAMVVVLHGGFGAAKHIADARAESGLNLDAAADAGGFVVAYLNGTPVIRILGGRFLGWNAGGGCCGLPARANVDDVAYIRGAVDDLVARYGIDRTRVYATGHSNGAMMAERMVCETDAFAAVVAFSGPLTGEAPDCAHAAGKRILAIHGADDRNVPLGGGRGRGLAGADFGSEERARRIFTDAGATYTLQIVPGADHSLNHIEAAIRKAEGVGLAEKTVQFLGLAPR